MTWCCAVDALDGVVGDAAELQDGLVVVAEDPQARVSAVGVGVALEIFGLPGEIERVADPHLSAGVSLIQAHGGVVSPIIR